MMLALVFESAVILRHSMAGNARVLSELWQRASWLLGLGGLIFLLGLILYVYDKKSDL